MWGQDVFTFFLTISPVFVGPIIKRSYEIIYPGLTFIHTAMF